MGTWTIDVQWGLFHQNPKFLGLGRQFGQFSFWAFSANSSSHFGTVSPLSMFTINQPLFLQKKAFIPNIYLELGFEFGPQRMRDLAIVYP